MPFARSTRPLFAAAAAAAAALLSATAAAESRSIYEIAKDDGNFSSLVAAVDAAGFAEGLSDDDAALTLFAPPDAAFGALPNELVEKLFDEGWKPQLRDLLLHHVLDSVVNSTEIEDGMSAAAMNGENITFSLGPPRANGVDLTAVDVEASNGLIHAIDGVLLPASVDSDVVDIASGRDDLSTLVDLVTDAELADDLAGEGPFTILAPSNEAFGQLSQETLDALQDDKDLLADVLLYHVVAANYDAAALSEIDTAETLNGGSIAISPSESGVKVNDAQVLYPDIIASNGIIHVIDAVLLPPSDTASPTNAPTGTASPTNAPPRTLSPTNAPNGMPKSIYELGKANEDFSSLVAAVDAAGFADFLSNDDEALTLFAPPNAAFGALPEELVEKLLDEEWRPQLQDLLSYHLLDSVVASADVQDGMSVDTLNGESIAFGLDPPRVNGYANLVDVDVEATNGLVHVIDGVLLPASVNSTVVDRALGRGDLSTLAALVDGAGLADALAGAGPFTIFAPNDDAFDELAEDLVDALMADPDFLADVLMYHVVPANIDETTLAGGDIDALETLNGDSVAISLTRRSRVKVNDARILDPDIVASNGIVHVIDSVLIPPSDASPTAMPTMSSSSKSLKRSKTSKGSKSKSSKGSKGSKNSKKHAKSSKSETEESDSSTESTVTSGKSSKGKKRKKSKKSERGKKHVRAVGLFS